MFFLLSSKQGDNIQEVENQDLQRTHTHTYQEVRVFTLDTSDSIFKFAFEKIGANKLLSGHAPC